MTIVGAILMVPPRRFYTVCLPVVWAVTSLVNFRYPGDEYGLWAVGSMAGVWILWLITWLSSGRDTIYLVPAVVGAGALTMAALGWLMDKLRCPLLPFLAVWLASTTALVLYSLAQFPSYDRAMMKNGSLAAYILSALDLCLLLVNVATIAALALWQIAKSRLASGRNPSALTGRALLVAIILGCLGTAALADDSPSIVDLYEAKTKTVPLGKKQSIAMPYRLMKPKTIEDKKRYPLVLYMHGAGERGTDNQKHLGAAAVVLASDENREKYPCFLLAPQCPEEMAWASTASKSDPRGEPGKKPSQPMQAVLAILDEVVKRYPIDKQRIYVTGISLGGRGTWEIAQRMPEKFAAVAPICNGGYEKYAARLVDVPVWAWHGDADDVIPVERSRGMIAAIEKAGGKPKYTELKGVGHDSWTAAYTGPDNLFPWMFEQVKPRGKKVTAKGKAP